MRWPPVTGAPKAKLLRAWATYTKRRGIGIGRRSSCWQGRGTPRSSLPIGRLTRSREYYERAVPVLSRCGPPAASILAATSLGFLHDLQSEYREAERALAQAMEQMQRAGDWSDLIRATWFRGIVLANQGRVGE